MSKNSAHRHAREPTITLGDEQFFNPDTTLKYLEHFQYAKSRCYVSRFRGDIGP